MRILIVHKSVIPVTMYGGTERVIWYLGKELVKLGHEVTFLVNKGSHCDFASVIHIDENKPVVDQVPENFDVAHFNYFPDNLERVKIPYLATMHGNLNDSTELDYNTVFVSKNHALRFGSESYVYNGLDWDDYLKPDLNMKRDHFHFLGNAAWRVKNVKGAINIINSLKSEKLVVLGGTRFNFKMGMRFTFSPKIKFKGMVGGEEKFKLLNTSKGLIFPVKWHEPFGLAITESLFYGCPIFGTPYGSLPELVKPEVGFLSNNSKELAEAVSNADRFSAEVCHNYAVEEFNSQKMASRYVEKYQKVITGEKLNTKKPKIQNIQKEKFLDWS
ncbi:glycosyltransferase [Marinigracilibium pacificum]|uniref:Glycosyltransferase family 4 protein n=1 Tax=Marinigracilibium pacificum TaxID=2729599 RepID=A0A848IVQ0_9BACT|nr:glycosyltransferase [Marinigracilibium pacificum]NMM47766.1 glycosyltransferase family 4 protein [Marinigracilibium pacificum]